MWQELEQSFISVIDFCFPSHWFHLPPHNFIFQFWCTIRQVIWFYFHYPLPYHDSQVFLQQYLQIVFTINYVPALAGSSYFSCFTPRILVWEHNYIRYVKHFASWPETRPSRRQTEALNRLISKRTYK